MTPAIILLVIFFCCSDLMVSCTAAGKISHDETSDLQPCPFNLLCKCSKPGPEVGLIYCDDLPLGDFPIAINTTKAFELHLRRNGLRRIEENIFHQTGSFFLMGMFSFYDV